MEIELYDSHCHLSPNITWDKLKESVMPLLIKSPLKMNIMGTNHIDFDMIVELLSVNDIKPGVKFSIGIHPWWSHLYTFDTEVLRMLATNEDSNKIKKTHYTSVLERGKYSTEEEFQQLLDILPLPFSGFEWEDKFKNLLELYDDNKLNIGELGLDKGFRIPDCGYLGLNIKDSKLSTFKVSIDHQIKIMEFQLNLAKDYKRWVSVHNVNCSGKIINLISKFSELKWVLHSYSGSVDSAKQLNKMGNIWFGLSNVINMKNKGKLKELISVIPEKVLIETDLGVDFMSMEDHINELQTIFNFVNYDISKNWQIFLKTDI